MPTAPTCKLSIIRRSGFTDRRRMYKICLNDQQVGTVGHDAVLNLDVPSGLLKIQARIDWTESRPLTIEAAPNEKIAIEVSNRQGLLLALWSATFGFRSYLQLVRK